MSTGNVIDAHVVVVSEFPYAQKNGTCWTERLEVLTLQIFTSHFRKVTLLRPQIPLRALTTDRVEVPPSMSCRPLTSSRSQWEQRVWRVCGQCPRRLWSQIQDADVVYGRFPGFSAFHAVRLSKKLGKPTVTSIHGDWEEAYLADWATSALRRPFARMMAKRGARLSRYMAKESDLLFTIGDELRKKYAPDRTDVGIYMDIGMESDWVVPARDAGPAGVQGNIIYTGALSPRKGVEHLLKAVPLLKQKGWKGRVSVVGRGKDHDALVRLATSLGIEDCVSFLGYIHFGPELAAKYDEHDIYVLPSIGGEGRPKVLVEAMARGCAVIASRVDSVPHMVRHNENGLLVAPGSPQEIADSVLRLRDDVGLYNRVIRGGLQYAADNVLSRQTQRVGEVLRAGLGARFGECPRNIE